MSTLYNLEPPPTAKVLLNTTSGDLVVEIFAKQIPLASRNFLQHCLNGYYDGTIFHRLVPGFIIQGGDPTGTGSGGVSAINHGAPFADEFHSRLKFNRRGLLGMANSGDKNDNTSQFFFTLDKTPELQDKNTMFGRIEGDTIYNLMKMAEADLAEDGSDRPLYPTRIVSTEVLLNPFSDMIKQASIAISTAQETKAPKKKRKATKTLLSFGGEEGEEPAAPVVKKVKVNPNFTAAEPQQPEIQNNSALPKAPQQPTRETSSCVKSWLQKSNGRKKGTACKTTQQSPPPCKTPPPKYLRKLLLQHKTTSFPNSLNTPELLFCKCKIFRSLAQTTPSTSDSSCQLDVFLHNGDSFRVNGAQIGVFEEVDQKGFGGFLQCHDGLTLPAVDA